MSLVENSPIFQNYPWTLNGVNVGVTQYLDAFQRSNFWEGMQDAGNHYHTLLTYTVAEPLMLPLRYASPTIAAEVRAGWRPPARTREVRDQRMAQLHGSRPSDVSILSHEMAEWLNDPGEFNLAPPWGNIGEVTGCRRDLEAIL